jgi:hypothetical protein
MLGMFSAPNAVTGNRRGHGHYRGVQLDECRGIDDDSMSKGHFLSGRMNFEPLKTAKTGEMIL